MTRLEFIDRVACPDCGALAQKLGHYYEAHAGAEVEYGFEAECVWSSRDRNGNAYRAGEPGVIAVPCGGRSESRFGVTTTATDTRMLLALTHWCTNPDCAVVFNEKRGRRFTGELPAEVVAHAG